MSKRVFELTKEIGKSNQEVLNLLRNKGVIIQDARNSISDEDVNYVINHYKSLELKEARRAEKIKREKELKEKQMTNKSNIKQQVQSRPTFNKTERKPEQDTPVKNINEQKPHINERNNVQTPLHNHRNNASQGVNSMNKRNIDNNRSKSDTTQTAQSSHKNEHVVKNQRNTDVNNNSSNINSTNNNNRNNNATTNNTNKSYSNQNYSNQNNKNNQGSNTGPNKNQQSSTANNRNRNSNNANNTNNINSTNNNNRNTNNTNTNNRNNNNTSNSNNNNRINNNTNNNNRNNNNNNNNNNRNTNNNRNNYNSRNNNNRNRTNTKPQTVQVQEVKEPVIKTIILPEKLTLKELADKIKVSPSQLVKQLFLKGTVVTINQEITFEEAEEIALEYNCIAELEKRINIIEELLKEEEEEEKNLVKRPPVVCVMGHVDHGKTSLLDAIRETSVTEKETGGITQHIGAYVVKANGEKITFLDTPGHEAFTSMRMRGAKSTDIAILVVAADDGVMPQTVEAINHAKAAGIEIIVAINKIDKPSANVERVKQELTEYELIAEDWGGNTIFVPVSAHTKEGIPQLLEMIILTAEICELKANPNRKARGIVIEAELDKGKGSVATILVQKGVLKVGDSIAVGSSYGKVRAMMDYKGKRLKEAGPSTPVEILGLNDVPFAGEVFIATDSDKEARTMAEAFITHGREKLLDDTKAKLSLDDLFTQIQAGNVKELNIVVKADVQGSVEAVKQSLIKLSNDEVVIKIIHGGVGAINESDVILASASNAIIIGFNVRPDNTAKSTAEREKVDLRMYGIIYNAIEDIEAAMKGMLDPTFEEKVQGHAEVRQIFKASGIGNIAGSYVLDGIITRNSSVRILRDNTVVYEGVLASVKRFNDDVKEVRAGYECGLVLEKYNDIKEGDIFEAFIMEEIPR